MWKSYYQITVITFFTSGIKDEDRQILIDNVNIIYHAAASVRFDDPLAKAINTNVRSTRDIVEIALAAKNMSVFIHVSTTYCNTDKMVVEEKIYPPHGNWKDAIQLAEEVDQGTIDALAPKYIQPLRNTYTYAKSLAEHVVVDLCTGKIPTVILRPSVGECEIVISIVASLWTNYFDLLHLHFSVISVFREPLRGWNDNLNGPSGLLVAGGKGKMWLGTLSDQKQLKYKSSGNEEFLL